MALHQPAVPALTGLGTRLRWPIAPGRAAVDSSDRAIRARWVTWAAWGAVAAVVGFLAAYNLAAWPLTWFDEGSHLHVPKTLVQDGVYADKSADGYRYFGPTASVGPTVLLPIALAFKVAGIGLLQARVVIVIYLGAALIAFAAAVRRRYCRLTALLAVLFLVTAPGVDLLWLGRQVLGEVPAFAFMMVGLLLWWQSCGEAGAWPRRVAGAVAFGLAALTKNQFGLILAPTFAVLYAVDRLYYRRLRFWDTALPLAAVIGGVAAFSALQLLPLLGTHDLGRTVALWRDASAGAVFVFAPARMASSLKFLTGPDVFAFWGLPALAYGFYLARERSAAGVRQAFVVAFAAIGLAWYAFGSIGWPRYAFPALAVCAILVAKLCRDLIASVSGRAAVGGAPGGLTGADAGGGGALRVTLLLAIGLAIGSPLLERARTVIAASDHSPELVAAYLNTNVPLSSVVETWEPELGFLTDHRYHYPPSGWLDRSVRAKWLAGGAAPSSAGVYDPLREARDGFLVVGRFGKYTGVYDSLISTGRVVLLASIGEYDVYGVS